MSPHVETISPTIYPAAKKHRGDVQDNVSTTACRELHYSHGGISIDDYTHDVGGLSDCIVVTDDEQFTDDADIPAFNTAGSSSNKSNVFCDLDVSVSNSPYYCHGLYWHNIKDTPIYEQNNKMPYTAEKACKVLFDTRRHEEKLCKTKPMCVRQDAVFLIDLDQI